MLTVEELEEAEVLRVEDGNHGEYRPRPGEFLPHGGVAFIRATDMSDGVVNFGSAGHINEVAMARITKGIGQPGDILFSHKGTVGKLALAGDDAPPFVCSPQTTFWRALDPTVLDRRFLYAFMRSRLFQVQWHARKGETDMADYVSLTAQRTFKVPIPDIEEQHTIGDALEPIESQIRISRAYGLSIHHLAERLFRSWFLDLDLGRERGDADPPPLIRKLLTKFPASTSDPGSGTIPAGWQLQPLDSVARYCNGIAMQRFPPNGPGSLPVLKIAQLRDGNLDGADSATDDLPADVVVENGSVVFSWSGTLMVRIWCGGTAALNQHLFKVTSDAFPRWFYYFWTRAHLADFQAIAADKKTTMGHIKRHHLSDAKVLVPDRSFLDAASEVMEPMLERYIVAELQARRLETLRDCVYAL